MAKRRKQISVKQYLENNETITTNQNLFDMVKTTHRKTFSLFNVYEIKLNIQGKERKPLKKAESKSK